MKKSRTSEIFAKILIGLAGVAVLVLLFFLVNIGLKKRVVVLDCPSAAQAAMFVTKDTSLYFNGKAMTDKLEGVAEFCKNEKIQSLDDCQKPENVGKKEFCEFVYGVKVTRLDECKGNSFCASAFAASHIESCDLYDSLEKGVNFPLKNVCLFSKAYVTRDVDYCARIKEVSVMDESCGKDQFSSRACFFNRNKCIWGVSDNKDDLSLCNKIPGNLDNKSPEKVICYLSHVLKNAEVKGCEQFRKGLPEIADLCVKIIKKEISPKEIEGGILNLR